MNVGEQIRRGREALGMSQADLADAIWVSRNTVSNWETGATTPDIQSFVLMSALFGVTIDEMVKGDENVMARAVARDRNRLLVVGTGVSEPGVQGAGSKRVVAAEAAGARDAGAPITLAMPEPQGSVVFGNYERIDAVRAGMPEFRLVRTFALFSMSDYRIENGAGEAVGAIHRGRATFDPVYQLRVPGFERVQVRREWKPGEFRTVYTIEGGAGRRVQHLAPWRAHRHGHGAALCRSSGLPHRARGRGRPPARIRRRHDVPAAARLRPPLGAHERGVGGTGRTGLPRVAPP